jgi:glyceraldehyde-3-phosphate dehydrogenase (NADP+)
LIDDAINKGASVINEKEDSTLLTTYSAVLYPVNKEMRVYHEEQFGPVVPIIPLRKFKNLLTIWLSLITVSK